MGAQILNGKGRTTGPPLATALENSGPVSMLRMKKLTKTFFAQWIQLQVHHLQLLDFISQLQLTYDCFAILHVSSLRTITFGSTSSQMFVRFNL